MENAARHHLGTGRVAAPPMYSDLDDFLADLDRRKLLARISEPVSPDLEIAAVTDRACKSPGGGHALLFEAPTGHDMPVASNVYGSYERMGPPPRAKNPPHLS